MVAGRLVGRLGFYLPWIIISAALSTVGYGLLSMLGPQTSTAGWIGYQILVGAGRGIGMQMPLIAVQNTLTPQEVPMGISLVIFGLTFGSALFLSIADSVLTNSLRSLLSLNAPGVDVQLVISAGAYGFKKVVPAEMLAGVLKAYAQSIDHVFYLCVGLAGASLFICCNMGWVDIRKEKASKIAS